jgi:MEMO1 family protein
MLMELRKAAVAGYFYEDEKDSLNSQIKECFLSKFGPKKLPKVNLKGERKIIGLISPHAGYMYSGPTASNGFFNLALDGKPETFIIIGPNHTGYGTQVSVMNKGKWETPLGDIEIEENLSNEIIENSKFARSDKAAHIYEHSIEVQLPFLQFLYGNEFKFVPICMLNQTLEVCKDLGNSIAKSIKNKDVVIIASTDFTHYETNEVAYKKDKLAIDAIIKGNPEDFYNTVQMFDISMCGYGPVTVLLVVAKLYGCKIEFINYATSGDVSGDISQVVGYASLKVIR